MRLTLRTLLAYLDDTLDAEQTREIGQKLQNSPVALELVSRIKRLRQKKLPVPASFGPERIDPNRVAAYLDNELTPEQTADFEEAALSSDVLLAEVVASHEILTIVEGNPVSVPQSTRERMYGLVSGRESIRGRKPKRSSLGAAFDSSVPFDNQPGRERTQWLRLLGSGAIGAGLGIALWSAFPSRQQTQPLPQNPPIPAAAAEQAGEKNAAVAMPEAEKPPVAAEKPKAEKEPEAKTETATNTPAPEPPKAEKPAAVEAKTKPALPAREVKPVGKHVVGPMGALIQNSEPAKPWTVVKDGPVSSATRLMSLPGARSEIQLNSGAEMLLWGSLPEFLSLPLLESVVLLQSPAEGLDAEWTQERGRVVFTAKKKAGLTRAMIHLAGRDWELSLSESDVPTSVVIDTWTLFAGEPFKPMNKGETPVQYVSFGLLNGSAKVRLIGGEEYPLAVSPGKSELVWSTKPAELKPRLVSHLKSPASWDLEPEKRLPRDRQNEIEAARKLLASKAHDKDKSVETTLFELQQSPRWGAQVLGTLGKAALGEVSRIVDMFEEPAIGQVEQRRAAIAALLALIAQSPENDQKVYDELRNRKEYGEQNAALTMAWFHDFNDEEKHSPDTYIKLIDGLKADHVGLRELAAYRLSQADPNAAIPFNGADEARRERWIADWKKRFAEGKLPASKPMSVPQGRGANRAYPRG